MPGSPRSSAGLDLLAPSEPARRPSLRRLKDEGVLAESDRELLALLGIGLKDEAIARRMRIGSRTVQRRIRRLMDMTGVRTRFQVGVEAARRGWL